MSKEEIWEAISKDSEMKTFVTSKISALRDVEKTTTDLNALTKKYEDLEKTYNELKVKEAKLTEDYNKVKVDFKESTEKLSAYETREAEAKRKEIVSNKLEELKIKESFVPPAMIKLWTAIEKEDELIASITEFVQHYDANYREKMGKVVLPLPSKENKNQKTSYLEMKDEDLKKVLSD